MVLLCGLALAILVAILEFCWNSKKNAAQGRQSLCSEMGQVKPFIMKKQSHYCSPFRLYVYGPLLLKTIHRLWLTNARVNRL